MFLNDDSQSRIDTLKLDRDLRDAYVELLSAQFAINRVKLRYSPEIVAASGNHFIVSRSISASESIAQYLGEVKNSLPVQAGPCFPRREDPKHDSER